MTQELAQLLRKRVAIIADHAWRDENPASHLDALKSISEEISAWSLAHRSTLDPQLRHFLSNASFQKALSHVENLTQNSNAL